jgi:hypothetical protein
MEKMLALIFVLMATWGLGMGGLVLYGNIAWFIPSIVVSSYFIFSLLAKCPYKESDVKNEK